MIIFTTNTALLLTQQSHR